MDRGGLVCKNRFSEAARVKIPENMLAFQLGESTQIFTGGHFEATPHSVVKSREIAGRNISRNTFAVFMEPGKLERMKVPDGVSPERVHINHHKVPEIKARWRDGIFFREFEQKTQYMFVPS